MKATLVEAVDDVARALAAKGIHITAIDELRKQAEAMTAIGENIDAIRSEVTGPIGLELSKAGKASTFNLILGIAGFVGLLYTLFVPPSCDVSAIKAECPLAVTTAPADAAALLRANLAYSEFLFRESIGLNGKYRPTKDQIDLREKTDIFTVNSKTGVDPLFRTQSPVKLPYAALQNQPARAARSQSAVASDYRTPRYTERYPTSLHPS